MHTMHLENAQKYLQRKEKIRLKNIFTNLVLHRQIEIGKFFKNFFQLLQLLVTTTTKKENKLNKNNSIPNLLIEKRINNYHKEK